MKIKILVSAAVLVAFSSCKENKPATTTPKSQQETVAVSPFPSTQPVKPAPVDEPEQHEPDSTMAFIVSLYSIGSGIDGKAQEKLRGFIDSFEKKISRKVEFTVIHWGREGEADYCFPLKGLSSSEAADFISGAKEALKSSEHIHFDQDKPCRKAR
jgi:hypothetical protein